MAAFVEEAYLGSVVAERYVDLDPFVEVGHNSRCIAIAIFISRPHLIPEQAVGYFKEQQRRLDVNSLITTRKATDPHFRLEETGFVRGRCVSPRRFHEPSTSSSMNSLLKNTMH